MYPGNVGRMLSHRLPKRRDLFGRELSPRHRKERSAGHHLLPRPDEDLVLLGKLRPVHQQLELRQQFDLQHLHSHLCVP